MTYEDFDKIIHAMDSNLETNIDIQKQVKNQTNALSEIEHVMRTVVDYAVDLQKIVEE